MIAAAAALEVHQSRVADLVGRAHVLETDRAALQKSLDSERSLRHTVERDRDVALERTAAALARAEDLAGRERELRTRAFKTELESVGGALPGGRESLSVAGADSHGSRRPDTSNFGPCSIGGGRAQDSHPPPLLRSSANRLFAIFDSLTGVSGSAGRRRFPARRLFITRRLLATQPMAPRPLYELQLLDRLVDRDVGYPHGVR